MSSSPFAHVSRSPLSGEVLETFSCHGREAVESILDSAAKGQRAWAKRSLSERGAALQRWADVLAGESTELAKLMATEMGKPFKQGVAEVDKCVWALRHAAEVGPAQLAREDVATEAKHSYVDFQPLGVLLLIMPWNFPLWQVIRCGANALMAGNGMVLKHAPNVPQCALAIVRSAVQADLPEGLVENVFLDNDSTQQLIAHPTVAAVAFTGSTEAGRKVAATAGENLKKCVLELGGSDPYLVLADADLDLAGRIGATSRLINSGQTCISAKRFIVVDEVYDRFVDALCRHMQTANVGDPMETQTDVGPMAREDLRQNIMGQVSASVQQGAKCVLGGQLPGGPGYFFPPTVLTEVTPGMPVFDEETFGPVAAVVRAKDVDEAIDLANQTPFGLGAGIFSADGDGADRIARERLQAGAVAVNDLVKSDPRLPFGGIKQSGFGRELARYGMLEFVNVKTVWVGSSNG